MPVKPVFLTVPTELQPVAHACFGYVTSQGHSIKIEYANHDVPEAATLYTVDGKDEHYFLVDSKYKAARVALWTAFGRSCGEPTFVSICLPNNANLKTVALAALREFGVGLYTLNENDELQKIIEPKDLTLNIALPPLNQLGAAKRRKLIPVYELFKDGDWKRGFEEACKVIEASARRQLVSQAKLGMVRVIGKKGAAKAVKDSEVKKMPLGALADVFCKKIGATHIDSLLCGGLKRINPDRVNVAHGKLKGATAARLRKNVGRHMWTIHNLLRSLP